MRDGWREEAGKRHRGSTRVGRREDRVTPRREREDGDGVRPEGHQGSSNRDPLSYWADPHRTMGQIKERIDFEKGSNRTLPRLRHSLNA
jgi:hypothetical protein